MSDLALVPLEGDADGADPAAEEERPQPPSRDRDLLGRRDARSGIRKELDELYTTIWKGWEDQQDRAREIQDYWDCYDCVSNSNRFYSGNSDIYVPAIHDAVEAIKTRFTNQLFPQGGRYVQADGPGHNELVALSDHYIRARKMKTQVVPPLILNGYIEGQYNLYVDWAEVSRQVVSRETHGPRDPETGVEAPGEEMEDAVPEDIIEGFPVYEVLHDSDVLVLPATADSVEEALASGGSVSIVRRWSKSKIERLAAAGTIRKDEAADLKEVMRRNEPQQLDIEKRIAEHTGIRKSGKEAVCWEVWTCLPLRDGKFNEDGESRLCRIFFGPNRMQLGAKRNPYWNDRCPLLSWPVKKISGVFKGPSPVSYVASMQYEINDAINEGADAATYSAAPIVRRDPEASNGPLVFGMGAVWDAPAGAIELMTFPDLTPRAQIRVQMGIQAIFQNLGVNPSMLPQQTSVRKPNQAMIAQEQQVDLLTTAVGVTVLEEGILTPAVEWTIDLDYQFRDDELVVRMYGESGKKAEMQAVEPLVNRHGIAFVWRGGEQVRQNAMIQQLGTAFLNVLQNPQLGQALAAEGKKLVLSPLIQQMVTNGFGPELGERILVDVRDTSTNPPEEEDAWMLEGLMAHVHPLDDDNMHMRAHFQSMQETGDPHGLIRPHMQAHQQQAAQKLQAQAMQQMQMMQQGAMQGAGQSPGGPGRPPGAAAPQPGASPAGPRLVKGPPGMVHPDQMPRAGGIAFPRKF